MLKITKHITKNKINQLLRHFSYPPHSVVGMPALSPTMSSGTIGSWHKKVGESVKAGETFADVETDKASMAFEAQDDAFIAKILVEAGTEVKVGDPILITVEDLASVSAFSDYKVDTIAPIIVPTQSSAPVSAPVPTPIAPQVVAPVTPVVQAPIKSEPVAPKVSSPPAAPVLSSINDISSSIGRHSLVWGTGVQKSAIVNRLSKDQAAYIEKYGHSLHKPIKI